MQWVRKSLVGFFTFLLFVALLGTAMSTSSNIALSHPDKIETWLNQSNFYGHFVGNAIDQAKKSANSTEDQGPVTLSDTAVQQAAQSAFSTPFLQQSVKTFLDANYAWLNGKTAQPSFTIDLTQAKQSFAAQVGQYVQAHINSLPVCNAQQLAALGNVNSIDPLNITCRPPQLSAQAEAQLVTQRIQDSSNLLSNPVISAYNISPNDGQPYYQKYSGLPKLYQLGVKLPWIYGAVALISALGVLFLASRKRTGLHKIGAVLAVSGVILMLMKFVADAALNQAEKHIFNNASVGQLQQSLTNVLQQAEHQLVKVDMAFGLVYLLLALIILVLLLSTRNRTAKLPALRAPAEPATANGSPPAPQSPPATDLPPGQKPSGPPPPPKRPKLIQ